MNLGVLTAENERAARDRIVYADVPPSKLVVEEADDAHDWHSFAEFLKTTVVKHVTFNGTGFNFVRTVALVCNCGYLSNSSRFKIMHGATAFKTDSRIFEYELRHVLDAFPSIISVEFKQLWSSHVNVDSPFRSGLRRIKCSVGHAHEGYFIYNNRDTLEAIQVDHIQIPFLRMSLDRGRWPRLRRIEIESSFAISAIGDRFPVLVYVGHLAGISRIAGNRVVRGHSDILFVYCQQNEARLNAISVFYRFLRLQKRVGSQFALGFCRRLEELLRPDDWCGLADLRSCQNDVLFRTDTEACQFEHMQEVLDMHTEAHAKIDYAYQSKRQLQRNLRRKMERMQATLDRRDEVLSALEFKLEKSRQDMIGAERQLEERIKSVFN